MSEEEKIKNFRIELEGLINKYSMENYCNMPDVAMAITITKLIVNNNLFEKDKEIERLNNIIEHQKYDIAQLEDICSSLEYSAPENKYLFVQELRDFINSKKEVIKSE